MEERYSLSDKNKLKLTKISEFDLTTQIESSRPFNLEGMESDLLRQCIIFGIITFVVSAVYLSMIDVTSISVLQCYMIDEEAGKLKTEGN